MSGITALFVGGPKHGQVEALPRAFKTTGVITRDHRGRKTELKYKLDLVNFEPYVYIESHLTAKDRDEMHASAMELVRQREELARSGDHGIARF